MQPLVQAMDRKMMREMNQNLLLNLVRRHAPVSRTELKKLSGLSLGTIVGITAALIEQQLIVETGVAASTGGRKAELLELHPEGGYVIGIDLREHEITGALLNLRGDVQYMETWPALLRNNAAQAINMIAEGVEAFILHAQVPPKKILGLGCGVSGPVNTKAGANVDSWILNWHNVELGKPLHDRLHLPIFVENAVHCIASYEKLYGNGLNYHNFLLITLGRGLGLAIVIQDTLFRGAQGLGAEFGHIPFDVNGRICECGNRGCLEAYVADHGIFTTYRELRSEPANVEPDAISDYEVDEIFTQAQQGDRSALKAFELTGTYLGLGLATLVNLFNPECIILNGGEGHRVELIVEPMQVAMRQHIFSCLGSNLKLLIEQETSKLNWARGAGCLVLEEFFSSPLRL